MLLWGIEPHPGSNLDERCIRPPAHLELQQRYLCQTLLLNVQNSVNAGTTTGVVVPALRIEM